MIEAGEIGLVGGMYDVASGAVQFMDDTWMCGAVRHFYLDTAAAEAATARVAERAQTSADGDADADASASAGKTR